MQDGVQLLAQQRVDRGDVAVDRVAQSLRIDPQAGAAFRAEPARDRFARLAGQEAGDGIGERGIAVADKSAGEDGIAHRRWDGGRRRLDGHVHREFDLVHRSCCPSRWLCSPGNR